MRHARHAAARSARIKWAPRSNLLNGLGNLEEAGPVCQGLQELRKRMMPGHMPYDVIAWQADREIDPERNGITVGQVEQSP